MIASRITLPVIVADNHQDVSEKRKCLFYQQLKEQLRNNIWDISRKETFHIKRKRTYPDPLPSLVKLAQTTVLFLLFNFCLVLDEEFSPLGIKEVDYTSPTRIVQCL